MFTILKLLSESVNDTREMGERLARLLKPRDVVLLSGDLGAGKSEFARGVACGLGVMGPVTSPTFTLLNIYQTRAVPLHHFDWYRIEDPEELLIAGLDEYIGGEAVTLIEWHERARELLPETCLEVEITPMDETRRWVRFLPSPGFRPIDESVFMPWSKE